ncbi:hypothetical protein FDP41_010500 [Naegleria fowleri]|uniref:Uncharacterized protein n=1 Tax=Naegleria fowleri TaxID=5763 RepID=A0A6A5CDL4_NAEFO|nr:uncharacterized protein FDP41_010500 [Naegleria fowleri]KAF0983435.1 hypothetical protein FDP41_010500 [Naegleria fowleri]CAG4712843.1 unnamed protein product [Naegleria fowleri]
MTPSFSQSSELSFSSSSQENGSSSSPTPLDSSSSSMTTLITSIEQQLSKLTIRRDDDYHDVERQQQEEEIIVELSQQQQVFSRFEGISPNVKWKAIYHEQVLEEFPARYCPLEYLDEATPVSEDNSHLVPQRSQRWRELRQNRLTASNISRALGFFNPKASKKLKLSFSQNAHEQTTREMYKSLLSREELKTVFKMSEEEIEKLKNPIVNEESYDEIVKRVFTEWGSLHELNCVSTLLESDLFDQDVTFCEAGFYVITEKKLSKVFTKQELEEYQLSFEKIPPLGASPDGLLKKLNRTNGTKIHQVLENGKSDHPYSTEEEEDEFFSCVEIKCPTCFVPKYVKKGALIPSRPTFSYICKKPHDTIPVYYLTQMYTQMIATNTRQCYFCSWTATKGCHVFKVEFDRKYALEMLYWLSKYYQVVKYNGVDIADDYFITSERYLKFLEWSLKIVNNIPVEKEIPKSRVYDGQDSERKNLFN